jgi:hypothetical protein
MSDTWVVPPKDKEPADEWIVPKEAPPPQAPWYEQAARPITSLPSTYKEMVQESTGQMGRGLEQITSPDSSLWERAKGVGNVAIGGLGYLGAPINAPLRTIIGQPIQNITGIPREYTEFTAGLALPMPRALPRAPARMPPPTTERMGVTLSEGQVGRDTEQGLALLKREQNAMVDPTAPGHARAQAFRAQQDQQVAQAQENVARSFDPAGEIAAETPYEAGQVISQGVREARDMRKAQVDWAYGFAREQPGIINTQVFREMPQRVANDLVQRDVPVLVNENTPYAQAALRYIGEQAEPTIGLNLNETDQIRRRLSGLKQSAYESRNMEDARAASAIVRSFDARIDEAINNGLFTGDRAAVQAWGDARAMHRDYAGTFKSNDPAGRVVEKILGRVPGEEGATPNAVVNFLTGAAGTGKGNDLPAIARRLRGILTPEEWSAAKQGMFSRLVERPEGMTEWGPAQIGNRLSDFVNGGGRSLAETMYRPEELALLRGYAGLMRDLTPVRGAVNTSFTGSAVNPVLRRIGSHLTSLISATIGGVVGHKYGMIGEVVGATGAASVSKTAELFANRQQALRLARQMPLVAEQARLWQQAAQRAQRQPASMAARVILNNATGGLARAWSTFERAMGQSNNEPPHRQEGGPVPAQKKTELPEIGEVELPESDVVPSPGPGMPARIIVRHPLYPEPEPKPYAPPAPSYGVAQPEQPQPNPLDVVRGLGIVPSMPGISGLVSGQSAPPMENFPTVPGKIPEVGDPRWVQSLGEGAGLGVGFVGPPMKSMAAPLIPFWARAAKRLTEEGTGLLKGAVPAAVPLPEKIPGIGGHTNVLPIPQDYSAALNRKINRSTDVGAPKTQATELAPGIFVGDVTLPQWVKRTETVLTPEEIGQARNWYKEALPIYTSYFGDKGPAMLGAWLIANQNTSPSGAQLNAIRTLEQYVNKTGEFSKQTRGGLPHQKLMEYWDAILSGDLSKLKQEGSGQKIYDFIDSALGKNTRTFYGEDPRAGAPAVADVHSYRDMGYIDKALHNWIKQTYGDKAARNVTRDVGVLSGQREAPYEWAGDKMRRFADELNQMGYMGGGWTPAEVQAVGWTSMSKMTGRQAQTAEEAVKAHIRSLGYELDFGAGAPYHQQFPGWSALPTEEKARVHNTILPKIVDFARDVTGALEFARIPGIGGWRGSTAPSMASKLTASPEVARDVADIIGYLAQQDKIMGYRPYNSGNKIGVALYGDGLGSQDKVAQLWGDLHKRFPDIASGFSMSRRADGTPGIEMILDAGGEKMLQRTKEEFLPELDRLARERGLGDVEGSVFRGEEQSSSHDWRADQSGSGYLERLGARYGPDIQQRLDLFRRQELEPLLEREIAGAGERSRTRTRSLEEAQGSYERTRGTRVPLVGLPQQAIRLSEGQLYIPGPSALVHDIAERYMQGAGLPYNPVKTFQPVNVPRAEAIAKAFEEMAHAPDDPVVRAAYEAMARETKAQFEALRDSGVKFEFFREGQADPYRENPRLAIQDFNENKHLWVYPTESGFGDVGPDLAAMNNPLLAPSGVVIEGRELPYNDLFRIVHDVYGHIKDGNGFRAAGEENAWRSHSSMYSDAARPAMTSETRGQNSWVNYGPHGKHNRTAKSADTVYSEQKVGLLPDWAIEDGRNDPALWFHSIPGRARGGAVEPRVRIVRNVDVPYLAGASNDGKTVYIDRRVPQRVRIGGKLCDVAKYLAIHETEEHKAMRNGMPYAQAHREIATPAERAAVEADGISWTQYEHVLDGYIDETEHERVSRAPKDLYKKPYAHDRKELRKLKKSTPAQKETKQEVDYSRGMPSKHCGICMFYSDHTCEKVRGYINPRFWCKRFRHESGS